MFYREAGQFKTSYIADGQIFPIRQDRIAFALLLLVAFVAIPLCAGEYWFLRHPDSLPRFWPLQHLA